MGSVTTKSFCGKCESYKKSNISSSSKQQQDEKKDIYKELNKKRKEDWQILS
jgi:hypothetical protein